MHLCQLTISSHHFWVGSTASKSTQKWWLKMVNWQRYFHNGAKVKNLCFAKLDDFRKTSAISSIFIKTFLNFFFVKDLTNRVFFSKLKAFNGIRFWLGCDVWKMNDLFQRPLGLISIILNFSKKNLVKAEI